MTTQTQTPALTAAEMDALWGREPRPAERHTAERDEWARRDDDLDHGKGE